MTNREYILQKLAGFNVTEAVLAESGLNLDAEYVPNEETGRSLVGILEELLLAPYLKNVSENGFSVSWDREKVGNWYLYLCKKYGIEPNPDILPILGISMITDISDIW